MNQLQYRLAQLTADVIERALRPRAYLDGTRVLMFHDFNTHGKTSDIYSMPICRFESSIRALAVFRSIRGTEFVALSELPQPGIAFTFDDGFSSVLTLATPTLQEHRIPYTIFVVQDFVESGLPQYLTRRDIRELAELEGVTIGLHGKRHERFASLTRGQLRSSLREGQDWLEQLTSREVRSLSYPFGDFSAWVKDEVQEAGFALATCSAPGTFKESRQHLAIPRIDVWSRDRPTSLIQKVGGAWDLLLP